MDQRQPTSDPLEVHLKSLELQLEPMDVSKRFEGFIDMNERFFYGCSTIYMN